MHMDFRHRKQRRGRICKCIYAKSASAESVVYSSVFSLHHISYPSNRRSSLHGTKHLSSCRCRLFGELAQARSCSTNFVEPLSLPSPPPSLPIFPPPSSALASPANTCACLGVEATEIVEDEERGLAKNMVIVVARSSFSLTAFPLRPGRTSSSIFSHLASPSSS
jgi:hypothetical protein